MYVYIDVTFKKYNLYVYIFIYTYTFLQYTQIYYVNTDFYFGYD